MKARLAGYVALLTLLVGCATSGAAAPTRTPLARAVLPSIATRQLAQLVTQPVPARNLPQLADQLLLHPPRPIPAVLRTTSPNYPVGHTSTFYILGEDTNRYFQTPATIRYETTHLYMYVQNGLGVDSASLRKAADLFEHATYPTDRSYFGSEWRPGVDGDPHIVCLIADLRSASAGGYFSSEDEYPQVVNPYSNQREMIYINSTNSLPGDRQFDLIMAHEFQHMIHWHMHPHDNAWLNEGMSMMAEHLNGFTPTDEVSSFDLQPETQLNSWSANNDPSHYGASYLFLSYLYDHYGRGLIHDIVADSTYTDIPLINDVLRRRHIATSANALFRDWTVANWIDDASIAGGRYAYRDLQHKLNVSIARSIPFTLNHAIPPYTASYVTLDGVSTAKPFTLHFSAPATTPLVGVSHAGPFWWSNKGDMSDTRLERSVDLRAVKHATLRFSAWYDTEKDYDYAYVEASTDGGRTWKTLPGTDTTRANPTGASYGNAYNGSSGHWRAQTVNLSAYAGKRIALRFEYVTDDVYTGQGFLVRNIAIPEIGFHDTFSGWKTQGFVPVFTNAMPLDWNVRVILTTTHGDVIKSVHLTGSAGSLRIDPAGVKSAVVVVSSVAPKTTVATTYGLTATNG